MTQNQPTMPPVRTAFVMEQALGHVTHYRNLRAAVSERADIKPTWLPIPFGVSGPARFIPLLRSNWSVRASWRARRALSGAFARQAFDAAVFHTQVTALFSVGILRRMPGIVSLDATPINYDSVGQHYGHQPAGGGFIDRRKFQMNRHVFHAATGLVTWSEWARDSLINDYQVEPGKVRVLAPGAAAAYFDIGRERQTRAMGVPASERPVRVLFVGGDFERKGGPLLLDSVRGGLGERCELHIVTHQALPVLPNLHVYRNLAPNSPELLRLFAEADIFVLPSYAECLAVVLMEATAAGLPVITTDVGALGEAIWPDESGLLIQPGDARALGQALEALVDDAPRRLRMGRAAHQLACGKFDSRRNNDAMLDIVFAAAEAHRASRRAA